MEFFALGFAILAFAFGGFSIFMYRSDSDALKAAKAENKSLTEALVDILDEEGNVRGQLRLPGSGPEPLRNPNKTPCGALCKNSFWQNKDWNCRAYQGHGADSARKHFLDENDQCVMFERSKND